MDKLSEQILNYAIDKTKTQFPKTIEHKALLGFGAVSEKDTSSSTDDFFKSFGEALKDNGAIDLTPYEDEVTMGARASVFAASVATRIYMMDKIDKNIDEFVFNPENKELFGEMNDDQKRDLCENLKMTVHDKMKPAPESEQGKAFVEAMTQKFDYMTKNSGTPDKEAPEDRFLMDSLAAVYSLNWDVKGRRMLKASVFEAKEVYKGSEVAGLILDEIGENSTQLGRDAKSGQSMFSNDPIPVPLTPTQKLDIDLSVMDSFWDKICKFFKSLFDFGKEKAAEQAKQQEIESRREKISFAEISGLNAATKLTSPDKSTQKTAEKKTPSAGK